MTDRDRLFVATKAPSHRQLRVGEEVRHILANILLRGDIPSRVLEDNPELKMDRSITITQVKISPDLRNATVYIMPLGGQNQKEAIAYLAKSCGYLRSQLGRKLNLKFAPTMVFLIDPSFAQAEKIETLIRQHVTPSIIQDETE